MVVDGCNCLWAPVKVVFISEGSWSSAEGQCGKGEVALFEKKAQGMKCSHRRVAKQMEKNM